MSVNITLSTEQYTALLAAGIDLGAQIVPAKPAKAAKAKKAKQPKALKAAKKHCYEARMGRLVASQRGGLTATERQEIAAELGEGYSDEEFTKAVIAFKVAEYGISKKALKAAPKF